MELGFAAGASFGIGLMGFFVELAKTVEEHGVYCDALRKIEEETRLTSEIKNDVSNMSKIYVCFFVYGSDNNCS
ncbi:MAG: hypothetical protein ACTSYF_11680 [Promethearchaeota archaeon]